MIVVELLKLQNGFLESDMMKDENLDSEKNKLKEKKGAPELRFKGFLDDWEQRKLGELGSVAMNKRIFKEETSEKGEVPFYKIGTFGGDPDAFISRELFEEYKSKYPYPEIGDILISASGSIGRTVVYSGKDEYFQDSNIVWLKHDERLNNKVLKQFYTIVKWHGLEGSTIKRLYNKNILDTDITIPSPAEQSKIGDFFEQIDQTIALHQRKLEKLKQLKQAYLQQLFPENGKNAPRIRFANFENEWEQCEFSELAEIRRGLTYKPSDVQDVGVRVLRSSNISEDTFLLKSDDVFVKSEAVNIEEVRNGDILITSANGSNRLVGKHAIIDGIRKKTAHGGFMLVARAENPQFTNALMSSNWYSKFVNVFVSGGNGSIGNLSKTDLESQKIFVPNKDEQDKIALFFSNLDSLITLHQEKINQLKTCKKALLQKMFI